jgi:hypothetical protein
MAMMMEVMRLLTGVEMNEINGIVGLILQLVHYFHGVEG